MLEKLTNGIDLNNSPMENIGPNNAMTITNLVSRNTSLIAILRHEFVALSENATTFLEGKVKQRKSLKSENETLKSRLQKME